MSRLSRTAGAVALAIVLAAATLCAQQANSLGANLTINNQANGTAPYAATLQSPGTNFMTVSGEPSSPFALFMGTLAPGWFTFTGVGTVDLFTGAGSLQIVMDGFAPVTALDLFARTAAEDGTAFIATSAPAGLAGPGPAFQAIVSDPTAPLGVTLSAATQTVFAASGGTGSGSAGVIAAQGVAGGTAGTTPLLAEVRAPIDALGQADVTILGTLVVGVGAQTQIRDLANQTMPFSSLLVGDFAKFKLFFDTATNLWSAFEIHLELPAAGYLVKVKANVEAATANDVQLLGVLFVATATSQINIPGGLAALVVGDWVEIKANLTAGVYEIVEIHPTNPVLGLFNTYLRTRSYVDATTATTLTVLGITINVGTGVRFDGFSNLSQLTTSTWVEVRANPDTSGQLWATRIKIRNPDNEVRIEGPVDNLAAPGFTIYGVSIQTTASTQWQNTLTGFSDLTTGMRVEVHGTISGGVITATEVGRDT